MKMTQKLTEMRLFLNDVFYKIRQINDMHDDVFMVNCHKP